MKHKTIVSPPTAYTSYMVRRTQFDALSAEANRYGIRKMDFLAVLMRGWEKLSDKQRHEAIQISPEESSVSA